MRVMRLVGFGSICVSAGVGVWACDDDATSGGTFADAGPTPFDSGTADTGFVPSDASPDAPPPETLWCGNADGGVQSRCAKHQWDDRDELDAAAPNCKACPGRAFTCADLVRRDDAGALIAPKYDQGTKTLTIDVAPHAGEIVGGAVTVTHSVCYGAQASDASTFTTLVEVDGNTLRAPLANYLDDAGSYDAPCGEITYHLMDSCCTPSTVTFETYHDPEFSLYKTSCPDGG